MSFGYRYHGAGLMILLLVVTVPGVAQSPSDKIQAHLDAGEFGMALREAGQVQQGRDQWLTRIATAQVRGGATSASRETLRLIDDDRELGYAAAALQEERAGASGGASQADFDTLINLITTTVAPDSWDDVGGPGSIAEFPGGVYVDAEGVLRQLAAPTTLTNSLLTERRNVARASDFHQRDPRRPSDLRMVSLPRLERQMMIRSAFGESPTQTMRHLAGLREIRYLFVYPDSGDLVIAGPAGDWQHDADGRITGMNSKPVILLDDLIVLLRSAYQAGGRFGCSITPKRENLARAKQFLARPQRPLHPRETPRWIQQVRSILGLQDVEVHGIAPSSHVARVIVEADYHMKLVGMGLEPSVIGVTNYLDSITAEGAPAKMDVLRWWFTLRENCIERNEAGNAFAFTSHSVQLQSENEMINERGERIHTGQSSDLNQQFADSFTTHFAALAAKYPLYAELENLFDLALVAALVRQEKLGQAVGWNPEWILDSNNYQPRRGEVPREVSSIVNHRVINQRKVVAGVSGGVSVNAYAAIRTARPLADARALESDKDVSRPADDRRAARWWWD